VCHILTVHVKNCIKYALYPQKNKIKKMLNKVPTPFKIATHKFDCVFRISTLVNFLDGQAHLQFTIAYIIRWFF